MMIMSKNYKGDLQRRLDNPEFKKEYDALESEFAIIQALIDVRKEKQLTQKELASLTGVDQADISRIERGIANPTLRLLRKLAEGLDMDLRISFEPKDNI
jgi:DNA-binding XRE family transcriptional regulator